MSKRKNIIRRYDNVRIVHPNVFVRCGYPLTKKIMKERMTPEQLEAVVTMFKAFGIQSRPEIAFDLSKKRESSYDKVIDIIAERMLFGEQWGGAERQIYTEHRPELKGQTFQVIGKRVVKTGTYQPASSYQGYYDMYPEYEPAYLDGCETHVILELNHCEDITVYRNLEIERCNVELITQGQYSYAS
jgi:hypothetical protein